MLARQLLLRQARSAGAGRPAYLACTTPRPRPQRRGVSTSQRTRPAATGSRTTIGAATAVNVDTVPTFVGTKSSNVGLTKNELRNLEREYKNYLQNPYKLANAVKNRLEKNRYEEALVLARRASKDGQVVVSWNLLIDYTFGKQRLHAAIKLFNEMKKRQQLPNAATYSTIFRGCSMSQHPKLAVSEAMKIYMTMLTSNRLRPNIIHTNAVLQVCARALDPEAMMSVAETIDEKERKADAVTYSTLLHGLRAVIDAEAPKVAHSKSTGYTEEMHRDNVAKVIEQGKRIWEEVISKWRAGALVLDEKLVCAMGRILLLGNNADRFSVLDLLEQTMFIPNLDKKSSEARKGSDQPAPDRPEGEDAAGVAVVPKQESAVPQKKPGLCPPPTTKTLSLVLMALQNSRRINLTLAYWRVLTGEYNVEPDANNWSTLLYSLRRSHSSSLTVDTLRSMPRSFVTEDTFLRAFSTCVADNVNPQVMKNADAILDLMLEILPRPDLECLRLYVDIATKAHHKFRLQKKQGADPGPVEAAYGEQVATALEAIWEKGAVPACREHLITLLRRASGEVESHPGRRREAKGSQNGTQNPAAEARNYAAEFTALMRKVVAAWDRVISEELLPEERLAPLRQKRNIANRYVTSYFNALKEAGAMAEFDEAGKKAGEDGEEDGGEGAEEKGERRKSPRRKPRNAPRAGPTDEEKLFSRLLEVTKEFESKMPA